MSKQVVKVDELKRHLNTLFAGDRLSIFEFNFITTAVGGIRYFVDLETGANWTAPQMEMYARRRLLSEVTIDINKRKKA